MKDSEDASQSDLDPGFVCRNAGIPRVSDWLFYLPRHDSRDAILQSLNSVRGCCTLLERLYMRMDHKVYTYQQLNSIMEESAKKNHVPPDILKAVAWKESRWKQDAVSSDFTSDGGHGKGIMQLDDRWHRIACNPEVWDAARSIEYAAQFLSRLHAAWGGWQIAASHYNGTGPVAEAYGHKVMQYAKDRPWLSLLEPKK